MCVSNYDLTPYISCIQVVTVTSNLNDVSLCFSIKNQVCFLVLPSNRCFKHSCSKGKFIFSGILSNIINHKNYNFLNCDWFKKLLFPTNSLAKSLSDSLLSDSVLSDSLLSDSPTNQSHSKL